jgi:cellulose synthase (UDP-forming)
MLTWMIQRFKYAAGSLDILFHDNIFSRRRFRLSPPDADVCHHLLVLHGLRVEHGVFDFAHYLSVYRHSAGVRLVDAVLSPLSPFFIFSELAFMFGTWGSRPGTAGPLTSPSFP